MSYLNSVTIVGFVGADPEQRQARNNGSKFTVLSVATQRAWRNAEDEWVSKVEWHRVAIFRPRLAEAVLNNIKKGAHVLVEGSLVSSTYEQANGKGKKAMTANHCQILMQSCVGELSFLPLPLSFEHLEREVRRCRGRRLQSSVELRN